MHSFPLTLERKQNAWPILQHIARANNLPYALTQKLNYQLQHTLNSHDRVNDNPKY